MFRTVTLVALIFALGCKGNKSATTSQVEVEVEKNALINTWNLLTVENGVKTFTSSKEELTPRRGYEVFAFEEDGSYSHTSPGPTDRPEITTGIWKWSGLNELTLKAGSTMQVFQVHKLSSTRFEITVKD